MTKLFRTLLLLLFIGSFSFAEGQVVQYGLKTGLQYSWVRMDDPVQQDKVYNAPVLGYNAGLVVAFKVKNRYFLHTELLYSTKGKNVEGLTDPTLEDHVIYNYIDMPMMYNIQFKKNLEVDNMKQFKWYLGAGPIFSYWLGGHGTVNNIELRDEDFPPLKYNLKFGVRGDDNKDFETVYVSDANRFQVGLTFGGGIMLEPVSGQKVMIDLRFELGQTWHGKATSTDYVIPASYKDNLKTSNSGLRLSVIYLFEANLDKKVRNKGKSRSRVRQ